MEKLGFNLQFNYLDHAGMEEMLASPEGERLLELARNISVCLHEDWKQNLIREKGKEYQHFRPVKDPEFAAGVLAHKEEFLKLKSEDGKQLFRIIETENNGKKNYDVQFDLIRVPFEKLTKKWQEANLEAAKFALCLVKTAVDRGDLKEQGEPLFKNFEEMSSDVHLEWMHREGDWAAAELLLPYDLLKVDTQGYNQKDKDRAHVLATTTELTLQPNILARNRSIVIRAIEELFKENAVESGLNPEIMKNISGIQKLINESNEADFQSYVQIKDVVRESAKTILAKKDSLSFDDLEKLSAVYYEAWKDGAKKKVEFPNQLDVPYDNLVVDDPRVNHKNIARSEVKQILAELVNEEVLDQGISKSLGEITDKNSPLGKKVASKNESDYAEYLASLQNKPE